MTQRWQTWLAVVALVLASFALWMVGSSLLGVFGATREQIVRRYFGAISVTASFLLPAYIASKRRRTKEERGRPGRSEN